MNLLIRHRVCVSEFTTELGGGGLRGVTECHCDAGAVKPLDALDALDALESFPSAKVLPVPLPAVPVGERGKETSCLLLTLSPHRSSGSSLACCVTFTLVKVSR